MELYDLLLKSTCSAKFMQKDDGSFPSGHNGPYKDSETPVRNTSHWLITLLKAYDITEDNLYLDSAYKALNFIMSPEARPMNATFWHRKNPKKDFANGLIGQAWTLEALVEAYRVFNDECIIKLAKEVFMLHPYDERAGGWKFVNVDGSYARLDLTFNHQLWFAAAGSLLLTAGVEEVNKSVRNFMDRLDKHLHLYSNGLIRHLAPNFLYEGRKKQAYRMAMHLIKKPEERRYLRMKSVGYHGFNLYGFALLRKNIPDHKFWQSQKIKKTFSYAMSSQFEEEIDKSKYGYPYNPPGFEIGFALQEFNDASDKEITKWINRQIIKCFDFQSNLMILGGTFDKSTSAARIYEATRLKNYKLNIKGNEWLSDRYTN